MLPAKAMSFLIGVSFLLGMSLGFAPVRAISRKQGLALETTKIPTALFVQSKEEQDWLAEMDSKSYDYLREHKEPLFDHDDWDCSICNLLFVGSDSDVIKMVSIDREN